MKIKYKNIFNDINFSFSKLFIYQISDDFIMKVNLFLIF